MIGRNYLVENTSPKQRITIAQRGDTFVKNNGQVDSGRLVVTAPLQEDFGMTVGSEFATPFDTGSLNNILSKLFYVGGISQKAGIRMKKMYSAPEPTEISFDMEFNAYYDAKTEVLIPVVTLLTMTLGRRLTAQDVVNKVNNFAIAVANAGGKLANATIGEGDISDIFAQGEETDLEAPGELEANTNAVLDLISVIKGPPLSEIRFGDIMVLPKCYITSAAAKFSNVLDPDGVPLSAVCSITATLESAPIAEDVSDFFNFRENG